MKHGRKLTSVLLTLAMLLTLAPALGGTARAADNVEYVDATGTTQHKDGVTVVTSEMATLGTADTETWYVVDDNLNRGGFDVNGDVHLILTDGKTLSSGDVDLYPNSSLTVYGQAGGSGKLNITDPYDDGIGCKQASYDNRSLTVNGGSVFVTGKSNETDYGYDAINTIETITVNGGSLTAIGGTSVAKTGGDGIYHATTITVNGGSLTAIGGGGTDDYDGHRGDGYGILSSSGTINLNGGSLTATGGDVGIPALSFNTLTIKSGLTYYDAANGYTAFTGTSYAGQRSISLILPLTTWSQLYDAMQAGGVAMLGADVTCGTGGGDHASSGPLIVPAGKTVTLNLNGYVVNRGKSGGSTDNDYNAITVEGSLTLIDSSPTTGGVITGGKGSDHGGGVYVDGGTFVMNGGTISGNSARSGGGVHMYSGTFTMNDGTISGNSATSYDGGGVYVYSGTFNMNGGVITNNSAAMRGGGVYILRSGNTFNVSGGPQIAGNTKGGAENNVYASSDTALITVAGALTAYNTNTGDGAHVGISLESNSGGYTFTQGNTVSFTSDAEAQKYFFADNSTGYTVKADSGQAKLAANAANEPTITTQPTSTTLAYGSSITLSVAATAATGASYGLSYQWYEVVDSSDTLIEGATSASYAIPTDLSAGTHYFKCVVTATRTDNGQSASKTSDVATVAVMTKEQTPNAAFAATGYDAGTLTGVASGMKYSLDGGSTWTDISSTSVTIASGVTTANGVRVKKAGNGTTTMDSDAQTITVTRADTPSLTITQAASASGTGSVATTTAHEYSANGTSGWTACTGELTDLAQNTTRYVRVKASGTVLASDSQTVTINTFGTTPETTPNATFTATGADCGELSGLTASAAYTISGAGLPSTDVTADANGEYTIASGMTEGTLSVVKKGNGETTANSDPQTIDVTKAATPTGLTAVGCTTSADNDGKITGLDSGKKYEYKTTGDYTSVADGATEITGLTPGTYSVRVKASGTALASNDQTLTVAAYSAPNPPTPKPQPEPEQRDHDPFRQEFQSPLTFDGGKLVISPANAGVRDTVTLTAIPDAGKRLTSLTVTQMGVGEVKLNDKGGGVYTFQQPGGNVKFDARFGDAQQQTPVPKQVVLSPQKITVNGVEITVEAYNINGTNYFKLRDLAALLKGTPAQFDVRYDASRNAVVMTKGAAYDGAVGTEFTDKSASTVKSPQTVELDGQAMNFTAYNIGGNNFFGIRELSPILGYSVDYDAASNTAIIESK